MNKIITPDEYRRFEERDRKTPKTIIRLPCGHVSYQITKYEDKYMICPTCHKKFVLMMSRLSKPKVQHIIS